MVRGLRHRRPWALVAGLVLFGLKASTVVFLPITVLGLVNLASAQVRRDFESDPR